MTYIKQSWSYLKNFSEDNNVIRENQNWRQSVYGDRTMYSVYCSNQMHIIHYIGVNIKDVSPTCFGTVQVYHHQEAQFVSFKTNCQR